VRLIEVMPAALALVAAAAIMVAMAFAIERLVLRPLVNQDGLVLFMATIGITFFITGFGQALFGSDVYTLDLGIPKTPLILFEKLVPGGILVNEFDLWAAVMAGVLVAVLAVFFQRTRVGRALRAVADDHQAALSVGIPLRHIWVIVWGVAGLVALVAGVIWGSKLGVQFSIALVALKALPVLMLGGLTSVPGAIIGGLLIGTGEKLSEVFLGPFLGGGIENWFAYILALLVLLVRPQGLFGERIIERV
jgi:branched-chain amino acid transport system permease protein